MTILDIPASNQEALEALEELEVKDKARQERIDELTTEVSDLESQVDELTSQIFDVESNLENLERSKKDATEKIRILRIKLGVDPCPGQIPLDDLP